MYQLQVQVKNFSYWKYKILENINLQAQSWDFIWFFWKSGSWKSTLLKIIWSIILPDGQVKYQWENIFDYSSNQLSNYRNQITGFDFQENNLIENLNGEENLRLSETIGWKKIDNAWLKKLIEILEIEKILDKKIQNLSWWEVSRISLAKSLASKPKILISDEPWSNLDEHLTKKVYKFLKSYSQNHIVMVSSHDEKILPYLTKIYELQNHSLQVKI